MSSSLLLLLFSTQKNSMGHLMSWSYATDNIYKNHFGLLSHYVLMERLHVNILSCGFSYLCSKQTNNQPKKPPNRKKALQILQASIPL